MRSVRLILFLSVLCWGGAARAEVEIGFYSKDLASTFPHAFVRLTGTDDRSGQAFDTNFGFTPVKITPGVLFGPVNGMIQTVDSAYVARSDRHFSLKLTPQQYHSVLAVIEQWRSAPQPNYRLNGRNCVDFVADVAVALGLQAPPVKALMKKPRSFLQKVTRDNRELIGQWTERTWPRAPAPVPPPAPALAQ